MTSKTANKFSAEARARAVRMVLDHEKDHPSRWAGVASIVAKIGCAGQTLHEWMEKAEVDSGMRAGGPSDVADPMKALERENCGLRQANELLAQGVGVFCDGGARPPTGATIAFIDVHRAAYGGEPIGRVLPIAPSTSYGHVAQRARPTGRSGGRLGFGLGAMLRSSRRCAASSTRTSASTAWARSGASCGAKGSTSPAAPLPA